MEGEAFIQVRRRRVGEVGVKVWGWWRRVVGVRGVKEARGLDLGGAAAGEGILRDRLEEMVGISWSLVAKIREQGLRQP